MYYNQQICKNPFTKAKKYDKLNMLLGLRGRFFTEKTRFYTKMHSGYASSFFICLLQYPLSYDKIKSNLRPRSILMQEINKAIDSLGKAIPTDELISAAMDILEEYAATFEELAKWWKT